MQQNTTDFIAQTAWEVTKTRWKELMALPLAVVVVTFLVMGLLMSTGSIAALVVSLLLYLGLGVFSVAFSTALTKWCSDLYAGAKELDIEGGLKYGLSRFWGVIGTGLLTGIKVILWCLLLVIPGYYKAVMYSKSIKVSQLEKISGGDANRISQKMVSSSGFMRTLGNMMAVGVVSTICFYIYLVLAFVVAALLGYVHEMIGMVIAGALVGAGVVALGTFMQVYSAYEYLIYRDENKAELTTLMKTLSSMK